MIIYEPGYELRFRVTRVLSVSRHRSYTRFFTDKAREFKTYKQAQAYQKQLADQGDSGLLQFGVIQWMREEQAQELMTSLDKRGSFYG